MSERVAPRPDVPPVIAPVAVQTELSGHDRSLAPGPVEPEAQLVTRVKPLAPARFALQVTIGQETRAKLERAFEERLRAALAVLPKANRCSEGAPQTSRTSQTA